MKEVTVTIFANGDNENTPAEAVHHALEYARKAGFIEAWSDPAAPERPEAEYVKKVCKALRAGHQYSGIVDEIDVAAANLIEALYLAALPAMSPDPGTVAVASAER